MKYFVGIFIVLALLAGLFFALPNAKEETTDNQPSEDTQAQNFSSIQSNLDKGSLLVDVRTVEEFDAGHIKGAVNLPLGDIQAGTKPNSDPAQLLYLYCRSGNRSAEAKQLLEQAGFTNIVDLGAMSDVVKLGGEQVN